MQQSHVFNFFFQVAGFATHGETSKPCTTRTQCPTGNGYLKLLLEFGVTGGGLIIFFLACSLAAAGIEASNPAGKTPQQRRFDSARFGGLAGLSFGAFFQPQLLSLGDTFAMALLLLLFKPRSPPLSAPAPAAELARIARCSRLK